MREVDGVPTADRTDVRLTYDDFLLFPEDGKRHELIDEVHYVTAAPLLPGFALSIDDLSAPV